MASHASGLGTSPCGQRLKWRPVCIVAQLSDWPLNDTCLTCWCSLPPLPTVFSALHSNPLIYSFITHLAFSSSLGIGEGMMPFSAADSKQVNIAMMLHKRTTPGRSGQAGGKVAFIDIRSLGEISMTTEIGRGLSKNISFLRIFLTLAAQTLQGWDCVRFSSLFDFPLLLKVFLH